MFYGAEFTSLHNVSGGIALRAGFHVFAIELRWILQMVE